MFIISRGLIKHFQVVVRVGFFSSRENPRGCLGMFVVSA